MKVQFFLMLLIATFFLSSCKDQDSIEHENTEHKEDTFTPKNQVDQLNLDALDLFTGGSKQDKEEAIFLLEKALTIDSTNRMTVFNLSRLHTNKENYVKSSSILEDWLNSNSEDVIIRLEYALVLLCMDKHKEANIQLEKCSVQFKSKFEDTKEEDYLIGRLHSLVLLDKKEAVKTLVKDYENIYPHISEYAKEIDRSELLPC